MNLSHFASAFDHVIVGVSGDPKTIFLSGRLRVRSNFREDFRDILSLLLNSRQHLAFPDRVNEPCSRGLGRVRAGSGSAAAWKRFDDEWRFQNQNYSEKN